LKQIGDLLKSWQWKLVRDTVGKQKGCHMRNFFIPALVANLLLAVSVSACATAPTSVPASPVVHNAVPTDEIIPTEEATIDPVNRLEDFNPDNFDDSTNIDNPWYPLKPGVRRVLSGATEDKGLTIPHQIVFTVTDLTKVIEGVRSVVVYVEDYSQKNLVEAELAFFAQDNDGNVWYLGEYPEEYEDGRFVDAPAWIAGLKGAQAGIKMKAEPIEGTIYSQGWGPAVNWTDYGQVDQLGQETCVALDCYQNVLVIAESSLAELDAFQLKYYVQGVGEVRVGWRGADATKETLELVEFIELTKDELAEVRTKAMNLEQSALKHSKEVYAMTSPLE
jgi:hypothetical protein